MPTIDRRGLLGLALIGGVGLVAGSARAEEADHGAPAIVDANLVGLDNPGGALPAEVRAAIRASRLTLAKCTLNGRDGYQAALVSLAETELTIARNADLLAPARTAGEVRAARRAGKLGVILSFESVEMLAGRLDRIDEFAGRGVRVLQLSYNDGSPFSSGALTKSPSPGLTALGREAVARMNALGVTIDVSHSDAAAIAGVLAASARPIAATHTGCAALHPHPRNKSDASLRAIAERGGVVGIYQLAFLAPGPGQPTVDDYMRHLLHAIDICGEDHVGIGTDNTVTPFVVSAESMAAWRADGQSRKRKGVAGPDEDRLPFVTGLNGPGRYRTIAARMRASGLSERTVAKVLGTNFERLFAETWSPG